MRRIAVLDAPSNLGLRPPSPGTVPGCAKAPGALRDHSLVARLGALDAGCVVPPRYDPEGWRPGDGVCQAEQISDYTVRLADRIERITTRGDFPLVLGGDCSILLGAALAMRRRRARQRGRYGLVFIDGHSDFRHAGNAEYIGAAAGEDLALATGRGQGDLTNIDNLRPYLREEDVVVLGIREHDEYRMDLKAAGIMFRTVPKIRAEGPSRSVVWAIEELGRVDGFWVHVDVDVLDPAAMPAVDAPDPGGIAFVELEQIIADLVTRPACLGLEVTVFDPDYDPDGRYAAEIVETLVGGLQPVWDPRHADTDPDPVDVVPISGTDRKTGSDQDLDR
ncbi:MAG TPA: arginase family protein [Micromonosporaceae bacterium]|jgi:arginase|nr:arginase family protein [Micromonosporaceae bacterium]